LNRKERKERKGRLGKTKRDFSVYLNPSFAIFAFFAVKKPFPHTERSTTITG
jgi:hypothetical protein